MLVHLITKTSYVFSLIRTALTNDILEEPIARTNKCSTISCKEIPLKSNLHSTHLKIISNLNTLLSSFHRFVCTAFILIDCFSFISNSYLLLKIPHIRKCFQWREKYRPQLLVLQQFASLNLSPVYLILFEEHSGSVHEYTH